MSEQNQEPDPAMAYRRRVAEGSARLSPADMRSEINGRMNAEGNGVRDRRSAPRSKPAKIAKPGFFSRLFSRAARSTSGPRKNCCIVGVLMLLDRSVALDGLILEIGETHLLFRQGASFIFDRTGAEVSVRFGEYDRRGRIAEVTPRGYLVRLAEPLAQYELDSMLASHGLPG